MKIYHYHHIGAEEQKLLGSLLKETSEITSRLICIEKGIKSLEEKIMKTQAQIDKLTESVQSNTAGLSAELTKEAAEIKAAIESSQIDTTALEAAIEENKGLTDRVKDLFTPESAESPVEEEPTVSEETTPDA